LTGWTRDAYTRRDAEYATMKRRRSLAALAALLLAASAARAQSAPADRPRELKLSIAVGPAFALGKAGEHWARLAAEKSGGRLAVATFPGATLAQRDPARELLALREGAADLAVGSTLAWSTQSNELAVAGLPWLAPTRRQLDALVAGPVRDALAAALERGGVVALAFAPLGHRDLATTSRAVRAPADLGGMRIRVPGFPLLLDLYSALGARPATLSFVEAQAALKSGTLDAQDGTPAIFAAARLEAVGVRHVIVWGAVAEVAVFAVNRRVWDGWSEADRALVRAAAQDAARELAAHVVQDDESALTALRQRGMAVTLITPAGHEAFAAAARGVYDKWAAMAGAELVSAAEAAVKAAPP